jgi:hypothetical protein
VTRALLICHEDAALDREGLARWLASFTTLAGVLVIREPQTRKRQRIGRELSRVGPLRFCDVLAFRAYYALALARRDRAWERHMLNQLASRFPAALAPECIVSSPNSETAAQFIAECHPDLMIARCKTLLKEQIFSIPSLGTYVMHPGICPEYRNAHGCFWALANGDPGNVGMTVLKIDRGVDTGPTYGYFRVEANPAAESHVVIQHRVVLDHLDAIRELFIDIVERRAQPLNVEGRPSATWGQPWLSAYLRMRRRARGAAMNGVRHPALGRDA